MKAMKEQERMILEDLQKKLKNIQRRIVFAKDLTKKGAKQLRIQALGLTMETLGKLLGEKDGR